VARNRVYNLPCIKEILFAVPHSLGVTSFSTVDSVGSTMYRAVRDKAILYNQIHLQYGLARNA